MYKTYLKLLTIFLSTGFLFSQAPIEHYLKIYIQDQSELEKLTKMVSISRAEKPVVFAYASHDQLAKLSASSFSFEHLPHPNESFFPEMAASLDELREWNRYPTYDQYVDQMISFQANYPDICSLESIGQSVDGREILFVKISDNVAIDEEEPEFMYSAQMHGNELIGFIVSLNLIEYLLENYGIDNQITNLIDNVEIWINPLANPDGTYYGGNHTVEGAIRFNANGVDLNRNYPDWVDGPHPDGNLWQPENIAMMNFAADHHFVLSSNIHSGAEVVNYPWDTTPVLTADDDWWQLVSHSYADTAQFYSPDSYFDGYDDGITNGWAWYEIDGGRQDYMNYYEHCREMTLELTNGQMISEDELSDYWEYNRAAMVNYIEEVLYGVTGIVTNSQGEAIEAIITIPDHDFDNSHVLTHPDFGTYYRLLSPGTYNILYESYSYESHLENNVVLGLHESVHLDIVLNPSPPLSFTGVVMSAEDSLPIENAHVEILDIPLEAVYSDENGNFMFTPVYAGTYQLHIFAEEFGVFLEEIEIFDGMEALQITLDRLSVVDFESGSMPDGWEVSGNAGWHITDGTAANGLFSLQSGDIFDDQISTVSISMDVPFDDEISFFCKVACEDDDNNNWDYLFFAIDGVELERWDGEVDWHEEVYPVSAGMHTFTWTYSKDGSVSHYADAGWIDYVDLPNDTDVSEIIPGDVSLDGAVDILDVVMTVNFILNISELSYEAQIAGDLDENGIINILDLIGIVNIILSS